MKAKRGRVWEWVKTVLIILLACSALYLSYLALLPNGASGLISTLFPNSNAPSSGVSLSTFSDETLRPAALAVTSPEGRCALLYDQDDREGYTQASSLLAEALNAAGSPRRVSPTVWQAALSSPGVYWEYLGRLPLGDLTRWLAGRDNDALSGFTADRLVVSANTLYFYAEDAPYSAVLSADLAASLEELSASFTPNGARFAFETAGFGTLRSDSLLLSATPSMPLLAADEPVAVDETGAANDALSRLLRVLSFHPQTNPLYAITGGWAINDNSDTLRVSTQGVVSYRQSGDASPRYPVSGSPLDLTRSLAEQTVGAICGDARLYLRSWEEEDGATTVTYGYAYRGAAIQVGSEGWCAQFTLQNGAVTAFTLIPRHYTATDPSVTLLPQEQAAAAYAGADRWTLGLLYADDRSAEPLAPFWAARPS